MLLVLAPPSDFFFMSEEFKSNLPVCVSFDDETLSKIGSKIGKGVSDYRNVYGLLFASRKKL